MSMPIKHPSMIQTQKIPGADTAFGMGSAQPKTTLESFGSFLGDQVSGFLTEVRQVEKKVSHFTKGKIDIEEVAPEVSAMGIKVEAMSRIIETVKTALDKLLNTQM